MIFENIPKNFFVYWDKSNLSYLNYLTIISFKKYNPDWKIFVYTPINTIIDKTWITHEHKISYTGKNYFDKLKDINGVEIIEIDFSTIGFQNDVSEVHKSDYIRYWLLYTYGGIWSDMDIIYIKNIENLDYTTSMCYGTIDKTTFGISYYDNIYRIGFIMSSKNNNIVKTLLDNCNKYFDKNEYQSIGNILVKKCFANPGTIKSIFPDETILLLHKNIYLIYNYDRLQKIFLKNDINYINYISSTLNNMLGLHWYNGSTLAKNFQNNFSNGNRNKCSIEQLLKQHNLLE